MKKLTNFLICLCLNIFMIGQPLLANTEMPHNSLLTIENNTLYANGNSILIKKGEDGKVYAFDPVTNEKMLDTNLDRISTIYGGSKNATVTADVSLVFQDVVVSNIYGGGYSDGSGVADVNGDVSIEITGNVDANAVYGGGHAKADNGNAQANINGHVEVSIRAVPKKNHNTIKGGGYADTAKPNAATASVNGDINLYVTGRLKDVSGAGNASATTVDSGLATADVVGDIDIHLDGVDVREVYCGGHASGNASVTIRNINFLAENNCEIMAFTGGVYSDKYAYGEVESLNAKFNNCVNLYGYIYGGGQAYGGGYSRVDSVNLSIQDSALPASKQFDSIVAAGVYSGGSASGDDSQSITKQASLTVENCNTAATFYGSGNINGDFPTAVATVEESLSYYNGNTASEFEGKFYGSTVIAGGSAKSSSQVFVEDSDITVIECEFEGIWGGDEYDGLPQSMLGNSNLNVVKELSVGTVDDFDTISISEALHMKELRGKNETTPTEIIVDESVLVGTPLVYCDNIVEMENTLSGYNDLLVYAVVNNQSVWSLGQMTYQIETKASTGGSISESLTVNKFDNATITWQADSTYQVDKVLLDGKPIKVNDSSYTLENIQSNHVLEVIFINTSSGESSGPGAPQKPSVEEAVTESGEKVTIEVVKPTTNMKEAIGTSEIITTLQIEKKVEKVTVSVNVGRKLANTNVYVVQVNPNTKQLELVSIASVDKKGSITFQTDSDQPLAITKDLPVGFIKSTDTESSSGLTYYMTNDNEFKKGWLETEEHEWYFFDYESAAMQTGKWIADGNDTTGAPNWYCLSNNSKMYKSTWIASDEFGSEWYFVDENGVQVKDVYVDGYYIDSSGVWKE